MNTKLYVIIFLALIISALIYHFNQSKSTIDSEFEIALASSDNIDEIILISKGDSVKLSSVYAKWLVNDLQVASTQRVNTLLEALKSLSVSNPITGSKGEKAKKEALESGICVICKADHKIVYKLYLIENPNDLHGNFAYNTEHKYLVQLNSFNGNLQLNDLFTYNPANWQSKVIFVFSSDEIQNIKIDWPSDTKESFNLKKDGDNIKLFLDDIDRTPKADANKLKFYCYEFANVNMDNKHERYKKQTGPKLCNVSIASIDQRKLNVTFFNKIKKDGSKDKNNLIVNISGTDVWGVVSYLKMNSCLKKASFFMSIKK